MGSTQFSSGEGVVRECGTSPANKTQPVTTSTDWIPVRSFCRSNAYVSVGCQDRPKLVDPEIMTCYLRTAFGTRRAQGLARPSSGSPPCVLRHTLPVDAHEAGEGLARGGHALHGKLQQGLRREGGARGGSGQVKTRAGLWDRTRRRYRPKRRPRTQDSPWGPLRRPSERYSFTRSLHSTPPIQQRRRA